MPTVLNFDGSQVEEEVQDPPIGDPEPEPGPEPEPDEAAAQPEDRLGRLEEAMSGLLDYFRSQATVQQTRAAERPAIPKPDFGENAVASALWDRIEASDRRNEERWNQVEEERRAQGAIEAEFARLTDGAETYRQQRIKEGDPEVSQDALLRMLTSMGMVRDRRLPYNVAFEAAYNALAYRDAVGRARNQGVRDARTPTAKIPDYAPRVPRPTQSREATPVQNGKPMDRLARLKKEADDSLRAIGKLTREDLEEAF